MEEVKEPKGLSSNGSGAFDPIGTEVNKVVEAHPQAQITDPPPATEETPPVEGETEETVENILSIADDAIVDLGDGKKLSGKEARNRLIAEEKIRQRFGALGTKEQQLKQREEKLTQDLRVTHEALSSIDDGEKAWDSIKGLLEAQGKNPDAFLENFFAQTQELYESRREMSEDEKKALDLERRLQQTERQLEEKDQLFEKQQQQQQLASQFQQAMQKLGLSQEDIRRADEQLGQWAQEGRGNVSQLLEATPQQKMQAVLESAYQEKTLGRIDQSFDRVDPALKSNQDAYITAYKWLQNLSSQYEVGDQELDGLVKALYKREPEPVTQAAPQQQLQTAPPEPSPRVRVVEQGPVAKEPTPEPERTEFTKASMQELLRGL